MNPSLAKQLPSIAALCQRYGVAHLELFGSATSAEFNPESSDFDFLVELDKSSSGSPARRWIELAEALEKLLGHWSVSHGFFSKTINITISKGNLDNFLERLARNMGVVYMPHQSSKYDPIRPVKFENGVRCRSGVSARNRPC